MKLDIGVGGADHLLRSGWQAGPPGYREGETMQRSWIRKTGWLPKAVLGGVALFLLGSPAAAQMGGGGPGGGGGGGGGRGGAGAGGAGGTGGLGAGGGQLSGGGVGPSGT